MIRRNKMLKIIKADESTYTVYDEFDKITESVNKVTIEKLSEIINFVEDIEVDSSSFLNELESDDAFYKLKNANKGFKFMLVDNLSKEAEFQGYERSGLSIGGIKEKVRLNVNGETILYSRDYFVNARVKIRY